MSVGSVIAQGKSWARVVHSNLLRKQRVVTRSVRMVSWEFPPAGMIKINCDGSVKGHDGRSSAGGVLRDDCGHWLKGYCRFIGFVSVLEAELCAIWDALKIASHEGYSGIMVECDNESVILMLHGKIDSGSLHSLVDQICAIADQCGEVYFRHVYREANGVADFIATGADGMGQRLHLIVDPPPGVSEMLAYDFNGVAWPRAVRS